MFRNLGALAILVLLLSSCHGTSGSQPSAPTPNDGDLTGDHPPIPKPLPSTKSDALAKPITAPPTVGGDGIKHYPKPKVGTPVSPSVSLAADHVAKQSAAPRTLQIQAVLNRGGENVPLHNLNFKSLSGISLVTDTQGRGQTSCEPGSSANLEVRFENDAYKIVGHYLTYVLKLNVQCGSSYTLVFNAQSKAGNVLSIFETVERARTHLAAEVGLDFWNDRVTLSWPARANFYDLGEVNLAHGYQYEAVGHELGHALADLANINIFAPCVGTQCSTGEGFHLIDQCYNAALAYSEGWATFFSAWLYLDPNDPDAKFKDLTPRRAPVRIETVPSDVCAGPTNEWRVTAFFWDLIDKHNDGESAEYSFAEVWNALRDKSSLDTHAAAQNLLQAGFTRKDIDQVWSLNFLQPR